jgi:hypothetical protein
MRPPPPRVLLPLALARQGDAAAVCAVPWRAGAAIARADAACMNACRMHSCCCLSYGAYREASTYTSVAQAIDLVDEACANMRVQLDSKPEALDALERQRTRLQVGWRAGPELWLAIDYRNRVARCAGGAWEGLGARTHTE